MGLGFSSLVFRFWFGVWGLGFRVEGVGFCRERERERESERERKRESESEREIKRAIGGVWKVAFSQRPAPAARPPAIPPASLRSGFGFHGVGFRVHGVGFRG